jgi:ribosomal protein S11
MNITRRAMIGSIPLMAASAALAQPKTKMKIYLSCGAIGVKASMSQALDYAAQYGFEAIEADAGWLTSASESDVARFLDRMKEKKIVWAQAGLPVEFRKSEGEFQAGMKTLPATAKALKRAGVERVGTWLMPMSSELTYLENFKQHARRLREEIGRAHV